MYLSIACRKDVRLPVQMQRAMAAEAEATREARAKVCSHPFYCLPLSCRSFAGQCNVPLGRFTPSMSRPLVFSPVGRCCSFKMFQRCLHLHLSVLSGCLHLHIGLPFLLIYHHLLFGDSFILPLHLPMQTPFCGLGCKKDHT